MLLPAAIAVAILILLYWTWLWVRSGGGMRRSVSFLLLALTGVALGTIAYIERMDRSYMLDDTPVLITIAADLSLSMGAKPDPREHGEMGMRLERAQQVLLPILTALEASGAPVMISVTGFTAKSEMLMGWDGNLPQIREVIEYSMAPGILTEPGSDLGAALQGVVPLYDNLPAEYQEQETRKYLVVVSDGEQTLERGDLVTALADIRDKGVKTIALQVGLPDVPEGIPVYDQAGTFLGFQDISGQVYTLPDSKVMRLIAGEDPAGGIYVRAEEPGAVEEISDFLGIQMSALATSSPLYQTVVVLLWVLSFAILLWFV